MIKNKIINWFYRSVEIGKHMLQIYCIFVARIFVNGICASKKSDFVLVFVSTLNIDSPSGAAALVAVCVLHVNYVHVIFS